MNPNQVRKNTPLASAQASGPSLDGIIGPSTAFSCEAVTAELDALAVRADIVSAVPSLSDETGPVVLKNLIIISEETE